MGKTDGSKYTQIKIFCTIKGLEQRKGGKYLQCT